MKNFDSFSRLAALGLALTAATGAKAFQDTSAALPGVTIGDPTGAAPPPGWYVMTGINYNNLGVVGNNGQKTGIATSEVNSVNQLIWVPTMPEILGANYYTYVVQPIRSATLSAGGVDYTQFGLENTVISPINLSWNLKNGFFVALGLTLYPPDGSAKAGYPLQISRNYFTTEINGAVSYLKNGWNLTLHTSIDFNGTNPDNGYHSGTGMVTDLTAMYNVMPKVEFGLGGSWTQQLANDSINGQTVAANQLFTGNGYGNRSFVLEFGPAASYNFGPVKLIAYWLHDVAAANYPMGDRYFLKLEAPLYQDAPKPAAAAAKY